MLVDAEISFNALRRALSFAGVKLINYGTILDDDHAVGQRQRELQTMRRRLYGDPLRCPSMMFSSTVRSENGSRETLDLSLQLDYHTRRFVC